MNTPQDSEATPADNRELARRQFAAHDRHLWGLAYRMLGVGADADDVVQDCFVRLLRTQVDTSTPLRPWLVRVTMNLARDLLRARQRAPYEGPWLPGPVLEGARGPHPPPATSVDPEARYSHLESLSLGFLLAAEKLTELQRATLVLRDVYGYSVRETATALAVSPANVKTTLHRARAAMAAWENKERRGLGASSERVVQAMSRFFGAIAQGDRAAAEALLAADVVLLSDGAGEFYAARKPLHGTDPVARWCIGVARRSGRITQIKHLRANGHPGICVEREPRTPRESPRTFFQLSLNEHGMITAILIQQATVKMADLRK